MWNYSFKSYKGIPMFPSFVGNIGMAESYHHCGVAQSDAFQASIAGCHQHQRLRPRLSMTMSSGHLVALFDNNLAATRHDATRCDTMQCNAMRHATSLHPYHCRCLISRDCVINYFLILFIRPVRTVPGPTSTKSSAPSAIIRCTDWVQQTGEVSWAIRLHLISKGSVCGWASTF